MTIVMSPSHPSTFDVGANDKLSQVLEWNKESQTLFAKITYSEVSGGGDDELDPSNYKTVSLPFPAVKLDDKGNLVTMGYRQDKFVLGHLQNGPLGVNVVLESHVHLIAHRRNGRLSAWLKLGSTDS